eukprot:m.54349 g.54349  ORF g.54349 m.54349 type:complete len:551 (-) comp10920_c0_seq2:177-1829(-)
MLQHNGTVHQDLQDIDWAIIGIHMSISVAVGVFISKNGHKNSKEYLMAGRNQHGCTVAISLLSGMMSGISFLGGPGYSYKDGAAMFLGYITAGILGPPIAAHLIIPFYHNLNITTAYEYFEARFCRLIRSIASVVFVIKTTIYLGIVLYAPALSISTLTVLPMWVCILVTGVSATLYTIKGGMLAVIWTDFLQSVAMMLVAAFALGFGIHACGGFAEIYNTLKDNDRLVTAKFFEWNPFTPPNAFGKDRKGPAEDYWSMAIGVTLQMIAQCNTDQLAVQRWLTIKDLRSAKIGIYQNGVVQIFMTAICNLIGMTIYTFYTKRDEDPVQSVLGGDSDKVFPYFVLHELPHGLAGLLVAGVLGSTMSVFSGGLNSCATSVYVDIIENAMGKGVPEHRVVRLTRIITVIVACCSIGLAFGAAAITGLVKLAVSLLGLTLGPLLATNLLGMLTSFGNWQGALFGLLVGLFGIVWLSVGSAMCPPDKEDCNSFLAIGHLTFFWYGGFLTVITFIAGAFGSLFFPAPPQSQLDGLCIWYDKKMKQDGIETTPLLVN